MWRFSLITLSLLFWFQACSPSGTPSALPVPTQPPTESAGTQPPASPAASDSSAAPVHELSGIDVSVDQGTIDFSQVKAAGAGFVFVKATQGITYQDPNFSTNFEGAKTAGLIRGAYHYYMTDDEPQQQFQNFSTLVSLAPGDLPPVVDIETLSQNSLANLDQLLQTFLDELESFFGVKPIIYSGESFSNANLTGFGAYPLWLAEYGVSEPTLPSGWAKWTFWQYSQSQTISGIAGQVDGSYYAGNSETLTTMLVKSPSTPTP